MTGLVEPMRVDLVVLGAAPPRLAASVLASLPSPLIAGRLARHKAPDGDCYDRRRGQMNAACLLATLPLPPPGEAIAALTPLDLFVPPLAYVIGLSELGSRRSLVSWARLAGEGAGQAGGLARRLTTEVVHEVGHGLGLLHCPVPDCAMHRSLWPEAVDLKRPAYCRLCLDALAAARANGRP